MFEEGIFLVGHVTFTLPYMFGNAGIESELSHKAQ